MLAKLTSTTDPQQLLDQLTRELAAAGRWHELFEARLVEARHKLGLPPHLSRPLDELDEPVRTQLEHAYAEACREVGRLLLDAGQIRAAWPYLRAAGEKSLVQKALATAVPHDDTVDELVELALYEQVDVERGFGWLLGHLGVCNAVTTLEGMAHALPPDQLAACAAALVRRLHADLTATLRSLINERGEQVPRGATIYQLLEHRDWLFDNGAYHIDTSHLAATVRTARVLRDRGLVELAAQLAHYGTRLPDDLQYARETPFDDGFAAYELFFDATLGRRVDEAVDFFTRQADEHSPQTAGMAATETLLVLLDRLGHSREALAELVGRVPPQAALSPFAPSALDLAKRSGDWETYDKLAARNDDPVAFVLGCIARRG